MIEAVVYLAIVLAIAGIGVWVGIIVAGRIDRATTPAGVESTDPPPIEESS